MAQRASAVHILEVAFSRLICCSRVCKASRYAGRSYLSLLKPIIRPGMSRLYSSLVAMYPAVGPPNPIGKPKR